MIIYKYRLEVANRQILMLPEGAKILDVQPQGQELCLWAMVDEDAPTENRHFSVYGTGHHLPSHIGEHIATVQAGPLVWHIFEV